MGHIPYPPPQEVENYETKVTEGDIVRIKHPEQMSQKPPEKIIGKPLKVTQIDTTNSELTVEFDDETFTIPIANANLSTRTPTEIVESIIEHFR
jgi:hypothetical protein